MAYSEDHIALAAEYALGTLDAEERAQVEAMMSVDGGLRGDGRGVGTEARGAQSDGRDGRAAPVDLGKHQGRDWTFGRAAAVGAAECAGAARSRNRPACHRRGQFQRDPVLQAGAALARCRDSDDGDRSRAGRDGHHRALSTGSASRGAPPHAANPNGRGQDARRSQRRHPRNTSRCCRKRVGRPRSF